MKIICSALGARLSSAFPTAPCKIVNRCHLLVYKIDWSNNCCL